jgi:hypothetical protein
MGDRPQQRIGSCCQESHTRIPTHAAPHASRTYIIGCLHASHGMPTPWPNDAASKDALELTVRE